MRVSYFSFTILLAITTLLTNSNAQAQTPTYHMNLVYDSEPTGPNETFYVRLIMQEHSIDLAGYQLIVGYDNTRGTFNNITDNIGIGGSGAGAVFTTGVQELALSGVTYANVARKIILDTAMPIYAPVDPNLDFNLGLLEFTTSGTYNTSDGHFGIYLAIDPAAGTYGVWDGAITPIDVEFASLEPGSAVADWAMY